MDKRIKCASLALASKTSFWFDAQNNHKEVQVGQLVTVSYAVAVNEESGNGEVLNAVSGAFSNCGADGSGEPSDDNCLTTHAVAGSSFITDLANTGQDLRFVLLAAAVVIPGLSLWMIKSRPTSYKLGA